MMWAGSHDSNGSISQKFPEGISSLLNIKYRNLSLTVTGT